MGIGQQANLQIETDWEQESKNKPKSEQEALEKKRQQQMQQAQQAARTAAQAQQQANQQASGIAARMGRAPAVPWKKVKMNEFDGENEWNMIRSRLHERLTQDVDSSVPEEYRSAIESYFKNIATPDDEAGTE